jgi:hypothetical protein
MAGLGLWAALAGAQPGCARQLTNSQVALGAVGVAIVLGAIVLDGAATNCNLRSTCPMRPVTVPDARAAGR